MNLKRFLSALLTVVLCLSLCAPVFAVENTEYDDGWLHVTIDPGHGGIDSGCVAVYDGKTYTERDICMQIGLYLKEELESYRNVAVSMTRTPDTPNSKLPSGEIEWRVKYAQEQSADILISLHLNDVGPDTAVPNGAWSLVSNGNYRPEVGNVAKEVSKTILSEIEKLGVANKGFLVRSSGDGTKYPNGKLADYYGIVRYGIKLGIPSFIIEHCFLRNEHDFRAILSSDEKLRAVAKADAAGIVQYYGLEKKDGTETDTEAPVRLTDIKGHWAAGNISRAVAEGWVKGYPDSTFRPDNNITRAEFVTLLARLSGEDLSASTAVTFPDVKQSQYYAASVAWAVESGIVKGFEDGTFRPNNNITREEMAVIMARYLDHKGFATDKAAEDAGAKIGDRAKISSWALENVLFCYETGLLNGRGANFVPAGNATRAEATTVLTRLAEYDGPLAAEEDPEPSESPDPIENPASVEAFPAPTDAAPAAPVESPEALPDAPQDEIPAVQEAPAEETVLLPEA